MGVENHRFLLDPRTQLRLLHEKVKNDREDADSFIDSCAWFRVFSKYKKRGKVKYQNKVIINKRIKRRIIRVSQEQRQLDEQQGATLYLLQ
jgi:hypothetical protein